VKPITRLDVIRQAEAVAMRRWLMGDLAMLWADLQALRGEIRALRRDLRTFLGELEVLQAELAKGASDGAGT
jgi:hypothetical protein